MGRSTLTCADVERAIIRGEYTDVTAEVMAKSLTSSALEIAELFTVLCDSTAGGIVSLPPDLLVMWRPQVNLSIGRDGRLKHSIVNSYKHPAITVRDQS